MRKLLIFIIGLGLLTGCASFRKCVEWHNRPEPGESKPFRHDVPPNEDSWPLVTWGYFDESCQCDYCMKTKRHKWYE